MNILKKQNKIVFYIVIILILFFIWSNSFDNQTVSLSKSNHIKEIFVDRLAALLSHDNPLVVFITVNLRKCAHFFEFACLGVVIMIVQMVNKRLIIQDIYNMLSLSVIIAVIDEFIQIYTGRGSSVRDVVIDFTGFLSGTVLTAIISIIISLIKVRKKNKKQSV